VEEIRIFVNPVMRKALH